MSRMTVLLFAAFLLCSIPAWSQKKMTLSVSAGSGFSFYSGTGTVTNSVYYRNGLSFPHGIDTIENRYGRRAYTNFMAGIQGVRRLGSGWVFVFSSHYEHTGGKLTGDSVVTPSGNFKTNGTYTYYCDFISLNPQIGKILHDHKVTLTLRTGIDYAMKITSGDNFEFINQDNQHYSIGHSGGEPEINDLRVTLNAGIQDKKWGLDINYKHGIENYTKDNSRKVFSRMLHIRVLYNFLSVGK